MEAPVPGDDPLQHTPADRPAQRTVMGINDRDYVRREGPSFLGSFVERGTICKWLIGINVAVFIVQLLTRESGGGDFFSEAAGPFTDALLLDVSKIIYH